METNELPEAIGKAYAKYEAIQGARYRSQREVFEYGYCLVNTPLKLIEDAKKKLMWTMAVIDPDTDEAYQKACEQVEKNSIYDDIPMEDRYIEFAIDRDQDAIDKAHARVIECREFLNQL